MSYDQCVAACEEENITPPVIVQWKGVDVSVTNILLYVIGTGLVASLVIILSVLGFKSYRNDNRKREEQISSITMFYEPYACINLRRERSLQKMAFLAKKEAETKATVSRSSTLNTKEKRRSSYAILEHDEHHGHGPLAKASSRTKFTLRSRRTIGDIPLTNLEQKSPQSKLGPFESVLMGKRFIKKLKDLREHQQQLAVPAGLPDHHAMQGLTIDEGSTSYNQECWPYHDGLPELKILKYENEHCN